VNKQTIIKRIVIKIGAGSLETGFAAAVEIGDEGASPQAETQATLPPAPDLPALYQQWQQAYWQLGASYRLEALDGVTNVSTIADREQCRALSWKLRDRVHHWLNGDDFRPIREKLLEQLNPQDQTRILLQTSDPLLQRLPWYELQFFQRYRQAEVSICTPDYQQVTYLGTRSKKVRILAVLGNSSGLDTQIDRKLLGQLPDADVRFLQEPTRESFNRCLWDTKGWDILFFAGHSSSQTTCPKSSGEGSGEIFLNATDKLTIPQLKHALKKAIDRGLNTAIFNSCDGLGLATDLADLHIPQVLVMREPVPDQVAHAFLQGFLESFAAGVPFYIAVREAREKMQGLEAQFPCATWLPVIVQNLAETPPTWRSLQGSDKQVDLEPQPFGKSFVSKRASDSVPLSLWRRLQTGIGCGAIVATVLLLGRQLGLLEPMELKGYDYLLRSRPPESLDERILIITNTTADIAAYPNRTSGSSLSDETLLNLLNKLKPLSPNVIGLDIYHNHTEKDPALSKILKETDNLIGICKISDETTKDAVEKGPPPEIEESDRIGANDFVAHEEHSEVVRLHLLRLEPQPNSLCQAEDTLSLVVATRYAESNGYLDAISLPKLKPTFGGYHQLDVAGAQTMLNYRRLRNPEGTGCGNAKETPADCLSVSDVLAKTPDQLRRHVDNKIVLIGTTDFDFAAGDRWTTPYTENSALPRNKVPGVFLHAQMISQLISAAFDDRLIIDSWPDWQEMIWITSWALLGGLLGAFSRWPINLWIRLLMGEGILLLACWLWLVGAGFWVPLVPSAIALPTAAIATQVTRPRSAIRQ